MKHRVAILVLLCAVAVAVYFGASKWLIHHETLALDDVVRDRPVKVDIAIRRDREMEEVAELVDLPVAIISHGNTVKHIEYSFLANALAARGFLVASIQHDIDTDEPLVTNVGEEYVGRRSNYNRDMANFFFVIERLKQVFPNADYHHLTLVGLSGAPTCRMSSATAPTDNP